MAAKKKTAKTKKTKKTEKKTTPKKKASRKQTKQTTKEIKPTSKRAIKRAAKKGEKKAKPKKAKKAKKSAESEKVKVKVTTKPVEKKEAPEKKEKKEKETKFDFKIFGEWDMNVVVPDMGLKDYINLKSELVPYSAGRTIKKQFWKSKKSIIERLIGKIMVSGHKGKKHWRTSGHHTGKYIKISSMVKDAFKIIEKKTGKNPVQIFVDALCHGAPREGITTIEYGGVRYPKSVDISPQRRVDLVLRWLAQGAHASAATSKGKKNFENALAELILLTAKNDSKSGVITKRTELERQAAASR